MRIVLAGRPGAGKSSLFDLLAGPEHGVPSGLRIAHVPVPDPRLYRLSEAFHPKKTTPARLEFQDLEQKSGPPWPNVSPERRTMLTSGDLLLLVVDLFETEPAGWAELAAAQWRQMTEEFQLLDLATIEKRLEKLTKMLKSGQKPAFPGELELLERFKSDLEGGRSIDASSLSAEEVTGIRGYGFMSQIPVFPAFNVAEGHLEEAPRWLAARAAEPAKPEWLGPERIVFSAEVESQILELAPEEQAPFLEAFGLSEPAVGQVIRAAYALAGLHCFFTAGDDEVRAWSVRVGATAPEAAGEIHSDLEKGFVRAEVLAYADWEKVGSFPAAKDQGLLRLEGKQYVVKDGDILNIRSGLAKSRG